MLTIAWRLMIFLQTKLTIVILVNTVNRDGVIFNRNQLHVYETSKFLFYNVMSETFLIWKWTCTFFILLMHFVVTNRTINANIRKTRPYESIHASNYYLFKI